MNMSAGYLISSFALLVAMATASANMPPMLRQGDTCTTLGLKLTDDTVVSAAEVFDSGKCEEAIKSLVPGIQERVTRDEERQREMQVGRGILYVRSGNKSNVATGQALLAGAAKIDDARGTSLKAAVAGEAYDWAVKDGKKGIPDLKARQHWHNALKGVKEDYQRLISKRQPMLMSKVRDRSFTTIRTYVEQTSKIADKVGVICIDEERSQEILHGYAANLRETTDEIKLQVGELKAKIVELNVLKKQVVGRNLVAVAKRQQIQRQADTLAKSVREANVSVDFLNVEVGKYGEKAAGPGRKRPKKK